MKRQWGTYTKKSSGQDGVVHVENFYRAKPFLLFFLKSLIIHYLLVLVPTSFYL